MPYNEKSMWQNIKPPNHKDTSSPQYTKEETHIRHFYS